MEMILVGAGGFGETYLALIEENDHWADLGAIMDPYAKGSAFYDKILEHGIPVYDRLDECLSRHPADLVIIASPIALHEEQAIAALRQGAHVLCEKPLTATLEQLRNIQAARDASGKELGVGYQWSFSHTMRALKTDILAGRFGAPILLKTLLSWPRADDYYQSSSWKGRLTDAQGRPVRDSILTNATAHYLHNFFFLLGEEMDRAAMPVSIEASLYRGRDIESFDTCFVRGTFAGGAQFYYAGSHVVQQPLGPRFSYEFELATLRMDDDSQNILIHWKDGRIEPAGNPTTTEELAVKYFEMREIARHPVSPVCGIETVIPHTAVCCALFDHIPISNFDPSLIRLTQDPPSRYVQGLDDTCGIAYDQAALPAELSAPWAAPTVRVDLREYMDKK